MIWYAHVPARNGEQGHLDFLPPARLRPPTSQTHRIGCRSRCCLFAAASMPLGVLPVSGHCWWGRIRLARLYAGGGGSRRSSPRLPQKKSLAHARTLGAGGGEGTGHVAESTPVNAAQGRCVTCQRLRAPPCSATHTVPIALPPPQCARGSGAFHQTTAAVSTRCGSCQRVARIRGRGGGAHCPNQGRPALCS